MAKKRAVFDDYDDEDDYYESKKAAVVKKHEFEEVEVTSEYMETQYYTITNLNQFKDLIRGNQFWCDYANYLLQKPAERGAFLTANFTKCAPVAREAFLAMCLLDLP